MKFLRVKIITLIIFVVLSMFTHADEITVEWIYGDQARNAYTLPYYQWLDDNTAILYDSRLKPEERNFIRLNPRTGKQQPALDMKKALGNLQTLLGVEKTPPVLPWPYKFHSNGKIALYSFEDDIFILHLPDARFQRATRTEEKETGMVFSPDGNYIAFVRKNNIYTYHIPTNRETPLTADGSETLLNGELSDLYKEDVFDYIDPGLWWSPDSRAVAYLQSDTSKIQKLYYTDIQPYFPRTIEQRYPIAGGPISTVRIGIIEIGETGNSETKTSWLNLEKDTDDYYIIHVDWLPDSRNLTLQTLNRQQDHLELYLSPRSGGKCKRILEETSQTWVNLNDDLYFLNHKNRFIWGSERSGYKHLYLYNLDGSLDRQITRGEWSVRGPFQRTFWKGNSVVSIDEKSQYLYFTSLEKSPLERHLYRIRIDGSRMQRITEENGFHSVTFSPDGNYYFDQYSTVSTLPSLLLYNKNGKRVRVVAESYSHLLEPFHIQYPELFTVPARDGFPLPARITRPRDFDPSKKYPVIIYHYGGPSAPSVVDQWSNMVYFNQVLLQNGFIVFSIDNRTATAIGKKYEDLMFKQMIGKNELNDLLDGVKWLKSQPYVDPERVGIWGWSYGGCFTLMAMTQSKAFKAGIAVAAVTDFRFHSPKWTEFAMKRPQDSPEEYEEHSLLNHARDLHGRLLLVHGSYDDNVRLQNAWRFVDELIAAGKPFDMMFYPMRKHGIGDPPARIHLYKKMVEFWNERLK